MARYITKRLFETKRGLDLKSSEIMRDEKHLTACNNVVWDSQSNLAKRPGTHLRVYGIDAFSGMVRYDSVDDVGGTKSELVFVGAETPKKLVKSLLNIKNNTAIPITVSMLFDSVTNQYRFVVTGGAVASIALGSGLVGGDLTVAGLIAALPVNVAGTSAGGVVTVPAAFIETKLITLAAGASTDFNYYSSTSLIWGGYSADPSFPSGIRRNPTTAVVNGCLYWYGFNTVGAYLYKYDGNCYYGVTLHGYTGSYLLGVHVAPGDTVTDVKGTYVLAGYGSAYSFTTPNDLWIRYVYKDATGFLHQGPIIEQTFTLPTTTGAAGGAEPIVRFNADSIITYENARGAKVNGAQANVTTIVVAAGHKLIVGDVAYFWDKITSAFVERKINTVGATSIIIDGGVVSVNDKAIISNNFRIQYFFATQFSTYVNKVNLLNADIIADIPYNCIDLGATANDIFLGNNSNTITNYKTTPETYTYDGSTISSPPVGMYVSSASNGAALLVAGDPEAMNTVYCSTLEDPELFHLGRNSFTVDEPVKGIGASGSVNVVGTSTKTYAVTGDIPNLNFRVEKITENLGIESAASVVEVDEGAIHFNTHRGPFALLAGRDLQPVGAWPDDKRLSIVEPYFSYIYPSITYMPQFQVASSYVIKERKWIITNVPWYFGSLYSSALSGTLVFDYGVGAWSTWTGIDASCGAAYWDGKIWFAGQGAGSTINLVSMTEENGDFNFSDHGTAISATIQMHWENGGNINLYKKFLWLTVHTPIGNGNPYNVNVTTYANYEITKSNAFTVPVAAHTIFSKYTTPPAYTIEAKLKTGKMASMLLQINNATLHEGLWYGGCEMDIAADFQTPSRPGRSDS
jgi:hypothetical protein